MSSLLSYLSRYTGRFGGHKRTPPKCRRAGATRPRRTRLGIEVLEDRSVPSADFLSALGVWAGNDIGQSQGPARDVAVDAAGNSYMTGLFSGTTDFDPAHALPGDADVLTARGNWDAFVAKYAPDNTLVWARRMGGDGSDNGNKIQVDGSGNVYVTGSFSGPADFGPFNLTSAGGGFVAKLNSSGTFQWANANAGGLGVGVDAAGNVYALGSHTGTYDVLKFNPNGAAVWSKSIVTNDPIGGDLAVDASGNAFVGGTFRGTVDFDPGSKTKYVSSPTGTWSGFVLKLTTAGKFGWVSPFVSQFSASMGGSNIPASIVLDGSGNVIVGGTYTGQVDFDPGAGTTILSPPGRGFITKLNNSGGLVWAKALEANSGSLGVRGLAVDAAGSIYAAGFFNGTVDFDPGAGTSSRTTAGLSDAYLLKLDSAGNFGWVETFGSTGSDTGAGVAVDSVGTVYLAGYFSGTVDFDPDPIDAYWLTNSYPGSNSNYLFLLKLTQP